MAYKVFCDCCGKEVQGGADRVRRQKGDVMIEVMVRVKGVWNAGHVCEACVVDVVTNGDAGKGSYVSEAA